MQGIYLCITLSFNRARKVLNQVLRLDPNDALGWLWLSRTFDTTKNIKLALAQAHKLNPEYPQIKDDKEKYESFLKTSFDKICRCPFCYAPIDSTANKCHYCKSYIVINPTTLSTICGEGHRHELLRSIGRFYSVKLTDKYDTVNYYSGLAYLNIGDLSSALDYFKRLLLSTQGKDYYKMAAKLAIDFIESDRILTSKPDEETSLADIDGRENNSVVPDESGQKKVLIVEDSRMIRGIISKTLKENGFKVIEAEDGIEALEKLHENQPDLVLLDIVLPKLDGYHILSIIKDKPRYKKIPVIILTSRDSFKDKIKGHLSAAQSYLTKPFKSQELIKEVNKFI